MLHHEPDVLIDIPVLLIFVLVLRRLMALTHKTSVERERYDSNTYFWPRCTQRHTRPAILNPVRATDEVNISL